MRRHQPKALNRSLQQAKTLTGLKRVRDAITHDLDCCDSMRDRAALYTRLLDTMDRIEILSKGEGQQGDVVDEIAKRRTARASARASEGPPRTNRA